MADKEITEEQSKRPEPRRGEEEVEDLELTADESEAIKGGGFRLRRAAQSLAPCRGPSASSSVARVQHRAGEPRGRRRYRFEAGLQHVRRSSLPQTCCPTLTRPSRPATTTTRRQK